MFSKTSVIGKFVIVPMLLSLSLTAKAGVIDFNALDDGNYAKVGDTSFSLVGDGVTGDPVKNSFFGSGYLFNSSQPFLFPTNSILRVDFAGVVDNLLFDFNGFGPESSLMNWRIFDLDNNQIAIGSNLSAGLANYDLSSYSGISRLEFFNGGGGVNRFFGLQKLSFQSASSAVSEPAGIILVSSLLMLAYFRQRFSLVK